MGFAIGTPYTDTPCKQAAPFVEQSRGLNLDSERKFGQQVRKHLLFEGKSPSKKMAPSTPCVARPACPSVINICDSDDESDIISIQLATTDDQVKRKVCISTDHVLEGTTNSKKEKSTENHLKREVCDQSYADDMDACKDDIPCVSTLKRKRAANVVTSDTEDDENDNIPTCKLNKMHLEESISDKARSDTDTPRSDNVKGISTPRRRLVTLRQREGKGKTERSSSSETSEAKYQRGIPTNGESEEVGSDSEDESSSFIVSSSDLSEGDDASIPSEDVSDGNLDFHEILSKLRRSNNHKLKWEFEADMLASFGQNPELCMQAVCALYRQQTSEEKVSKETLHTNNRGFSKFDALRYKFEFLN